MRAIRLVFIKEVLDNLRDRRTVLGTLLMGALIGPISFAVIFNVILAKEIEKAELPLELAVAGEEHAPMLMRFLRQQGVQLQTSPENPEQLVKDRTEEIVLRIPADYGERWRAGTPALVEIIIDHSRREGGRSFNRLETLLQQYSRQVASMRLQLRGVNPLLVQPVFIRARDVSTAQGRGAMLVGMLPFFLLITVFMGGMYLAIDATSGEKERQSLEPLLINPVPRWQIMLGKVFAAALFSSVSAAIGLVAFHYAMLTVPTDTLGFAINLDWPVIAMCFFIALPVTLIASCLQCIIAAFARGFREAQGYASFLVFIPMVPSVWLLYSPVKEQAWMSAVPMLSQVMLLNTLIRDEALPWQWVLYSWTGSLLLGAGLCFVAASLYNRPRMIFTD
jgi:sodium transport system permease protein